MKIVYTTLIFAILASASSGQGENNQWCFGNLAGLDFNSGSPVGVSSQVNTTEGSSSIADASGNLLFYSDGITVWNKNHAVMQNGTGLFGGVSSTQSALIVKQPQVPDIYYVFTTAEAQGVNGFCYSIVDMSLQGGLGEVTMKNVQLFTPSAEKVCATKHSNGIDIWVLGHEMGTNNFFAYLLTSAGLSAPVISSCGNVYSFGSGVEIGYMKFSPDGSQLAHAVRYLYLFELDSFDISTGVVSAPVSWPSTNGIQAYGIEFSPNGQLLYTSDAIQTSQHDITVHDAASIVASKTYISDDVWALQMGPDKKIYLASYFGTTLSVINDPDIPGTGCNYVNAAVPLTGSSTLGLPNQMNSFLLGPPVAIFSAPNHICPGTCTDFTNLSVNGTTFQWIFAGANPGVSTDANPTQICYNQPGQYSVTLIATNVNGSDTLTLPNFITVYPQPPPQGISQSGDTLFANSGAVGYQWYADGILIPGATDYYYVAPQSGNYNVVATDGNGCEVEAVIFDVIASLEALGADLNGIFLYPNPVRDFLRLHSGFGPGVRRIDIFNILSQQLSVSFPDVKFPSSIDVSGLSPGIYILSANLPDRVVRVKFIKQ